MAGLMDYITNTFGGEAGSARLAGLSSLFMAADQGRAADLSPHLQAIGTANQRQQLGESLKNDYAGMFNDEERKFLLTLDPQTASSLIADRIFPKTKAPANLTTFSAADGSVYSFNPNTGEKFPLTGARDPNAPGSLPADVQSLQWRAAQIGLEPGTPDYQKYIRDNGKMVSDDPMADAPASVRAIHMRAVAAGLVPDTPEYQDFMLTAAKGEEARAGVVGKHEGELTTEAGPALQMRDTVSGMIDNLINDPYLPEMVGPVNSRLPNTSADAARVQSKMDQVAGQGFLQARQWLKGQGAITDMESARAEAAFARLNAAQSLTDYKQALEEFRSALNDGVRKYEAHIRSGGAPAAQASAPPQSPAAPQQAAISRNGYTIEKVD